MLGNIAPGLQLHVLDTLSESKPFTVADTIDLWIDIQKEELLQVVSRVDLFVINDSESEQLTGEKISSLLAKNYSNLALKLQS